jgi:hypothetical protein
MERKLLAVVAADMVGFSRLVENNEIEILKRQKKHFTDVIKPTINNYTAKIIKTESASISYDVKAYRIEYATPNTHNKMIKASGLLAIPQKALGEKSPLLSYQHGTTFLDKNAPSNSASTISGISKLASTGYIVSAPDYIGYGTSASTIHPYIHASSLASASVDMLRAAKTFLSHAKYIIHQKFTIKGVVDKHDIIGAIFGQSEGIIGEDLDIRELQGSGKIGRIEIEQESRNGITTGTLTYLLVQIWLRLQFWQQQWK